MVNKTKAKDGFQIVTNKKMASILNKFNLFIKNIYLDYYEVFREIGRSAQKRPLKATFYGSATLFTLNLFRTNEDIRSYNSEIISACNRIGAVSENSRNPRSYSFVQQIGELNGHRQLRQIDLGFSTLIYKAETNTETASYKYNCSYLRPRIQEFICNRLVDLGFLGHWLLLETNMRDYDINESQYEDLMSSSVAIQQPD